MQERVQRYGGYLAAMVLPNIGAILAWGLITAFVIPTGWTPNETLATRVVGVVATMGIIIGSSVPMFLGAMIFGPVGAFLIKKFDDTFQERIPSGFEMLINNFSLGIFGAIAAVIGVLAIGPVLNTLSDALGNNVKTLVDARLLQQQKLSQQLQQPR